MEYKKHFLETDGTLAWAVGLYSPTQNHYDCNLESSHL